MSPQESFWFTSRRVGNNSPRRAFKQPNKHTRRSLTRRLRPRLRFSVSSVPSVVNNQFAALTRSLSLRIRRQILTLFRPVTLFYLGRFSDDSKGDDKKLDSRGIILA